MPARFTAYPPDRAALVRVIDEGSVYRIGRADECELRIDHQSVSRYHAELKRGAIATGGCCRTPAARTDLRFGGHLRNRAESRESSWFAVGDVYCWLEFIDSEIGVAVSPRRTTAAARYRGRCRRGFPRASTSAR